MSDVQSAAPSSSEPVQEAAATVALEAISVASDVKDAVQDAVDPNIANIPAPVTHESLLTEFVAAVRRDARGISNHLESLLEKAAHHFGL